MTKILQDHVFEPKVHWIGHLLSWMLREKFSLNFTYSKLTVSKANKGQVKKIKVKFRNSSITSVNNKLKHMIVKPPMVWKRQHLSLTTDTYVFLEETQIKYYNIN